MLSPPAKDAMKDVNRELSKIVPRYPEVKEKKARPMTSIPASSRTITAKRDKSIDSKPADTKKSWYAPAPVDKKPKYEVPETIKQKMKRS